MGAFDHMIRAKDRELASYRQFIESLQAEVTAYRNKGYIPNGFDRLQELASALKVSE